jgi:hypothetical protein
MKGLRDLSLAHTRRVVEQVLARLCPEVKRRRGRRKACEPGTADVEHSDEQQHTDWNEVAHQIEREIALPLDAPTAEQEGQLPEMLHTLQASTTAKARELVITKITKHLQQRAEGNLFSSTIYNKASVDRLLDLCRDLLEDTAGPTLVGVPVSSPTSLCVALSASSLWDLRFSKDRHKRETFQRIIHMGETHPARYPRDSPQAGTTDGRCLTCSYTWETDSSWWCTTRWTLVSTSTTSTASFPGDWRRGAESTKAT